MASPNMSIGNYRIIREIARGASGVVYLAQHTHLSERVVAIKVLQSAYLASQQERESFLQEASFLELLKHPYILPIFDVGTHEGFPYIIAEYAPNGSLKDRFQAIAPGLLAAGEVLSILSQVGEALQYSHQRNIIHRDIKPANILFNANGDAVLADFSIAIKLETTSTQWVGTSGTPYYMAPEQFDGVVSKKSDQYALGCIAYELVTGHRPFTALDWAALAFKHVAEEPIPPRQFIPQLPEHIERAILRALAKDRAERYEDVAAFVAALDISSHITLSRRDSSQTNIPTVFPLRPTPISLEDTPQEATELRVDLEQTDKTPRRPQLAVDSQKTISAITDPAGISTVHYVPGFTVNVSNPTTPIPPAYDRYVPIPPGEPRELRREAKAGAGIAGVTLAPSVIPAKAGTRSHRGPRYAWVVILATFALAILLGGVFYTLANSGPSPTVSITAGTSPHPGIAVPSNPPGVSGEFIATITPKSDDLKKAYAVSIVAHQLSANNSQSQRANATGQGTTQPTHGSGTLVLSNGNAFSFSVSAGTGYQVNGGDVEAVTSASVAVPANSTVNVPASAANAGASGNIAAYYFNNYLYPVPGHSGSSYSVTNPAAFTGGGNGKSYTYVRQSDIDGAANALETRLMPAVQQSAGGQAASNERLAQAIQCSAHVTANPPVNTQASSVNVTVEETCSGEAYDPQAARSMAADSFKRDLPALLGAQYRLVGTVLTTVQSATAASGGRVAVQVNTEGVGVFQFSNTQLQALPKLIAGRSKIDAVSLLLKQEGVQGATITIPKGGGDTLPTDTTTLKIVVSSVAGR